MSAILSGISEAFRLILIFGVMTWSYDLGSKARQTTKSKLKSAMKGLLVCSLAALLYASNLGTHLENCDDDPIRGGCDRVQDYVASSNEKVKGFTTVLLTIFSPYIFSLYNSIRYKGNRFCNDDTFYCNIYRSVG